MNALQLPSATDGLAVDVFRAGLQIAMIKVLAGTLLDSF